MILKEKKLMLMVLDLGASIAANIKIYCKIRMLLIIEWCKYRGDANWPNKRFDEFNQSF